MADGRKNNGGARKGAGRKPKADELKKVERMDKVLDPNVAWKELAKLVKAGELPAIKVWIEHRYGKPVEQKEIKHEGDNILPWEKIKWADDVDE